MQPLQPTGPRVCLCSQHTLCRLFISSSPAIWTYNSRRDATLVYQHWWKFLDALSVLPLDCISGRRYSGITAITYSNSLIYVSNRLFCNKINCSYRPRLHPSDWRLHCGHTCISRMAPSNLGWLNASLRGRWEAAHVFNRFGACLVRSSNSFTWSRFSSSGVLRVSAGTEAVA